MPFCQQCGEPLGGADKFCTSCGFVAASAGAAAPAAAAPSVPAGSGLSTNKGDDWLPSTLRKDGFGGSEAQTEAVLGEMIAETNRVFGELGVSVAAQKRVTPGASVQCGECFRAITGSAVQALGQTLHPQCFSCFKCHEVLAGESYVVRRNGAKEVAWCEACLAREKPSKGPSSSTVAPFRPASSTTTTTTTSGGSGLTAAQRADFISRRDEGKTSCRGCGVVMMGDGVVTKSGTYHEYCFVCGSCGEPIGSGTQFAERDGKAFHPACSATSSSVTCSGCSKPLVGKFVRASNNAPYHRECFVCTSCRKDLGGGYSLRNEKPYCGSCASAATPFISNAARFTSATGTAPGIRYNQVTREVTHVPTNTTRIGASSTSVAAAASSASSASPAAAPAAAAGANKFCQNCGTNLEGNKFCGSCGTKA